MDVADSELQQAIARDRTARARAMEPGDKLMAGARLFDAVRSRMLAGLRVRHPSWSADELEAAFREQLAMLREREERGVYRPAGTL